MTSQWSEGRKNIKDNEYLSAKNYGDTLSIPLRMGDYSDWEYLSDNIPDTVKIFILQHDLKKLKHFVYTRLI